MQTTSDDFPDFNKRISIAVEYCTACGCVVSSDGCSNPECWKTRPLYPLMEAMRAMALNKHYGTNRYKPCKQQVFGTR
jgi:hypothetical protein